MDDDALFHALMGAEDVDAVVTDFCGLRSAEKSTQSDPTSLAVNDDDAEGGTSAMFPITFLSRSEEASPRPTSTAAVSVSRRRTIMAPIPGDDAVDEGVQTEVVLLVAPQSFSSSAGGVDTAQRRRPPHLVSPSKELVMSRSNVPALEAAVTSTHTDPRRDALSLEAPLSRSTRRIPAPTGDEVAGDRESADSFSSDDHKRRVRCQGSDSESYSYSYYTGSSSDSDNDSETATPLGKRVDCGKTTTVASAAVLREQAKKGTSDRPPLAPPLVVVGTPAAAVHPPSSSSTRPRHRRQIPLGATEGAVPKATAQSRIAVGPPSPSSLATRAVGQRASRREGSTSEISDAAFRQLLVSPPSLQPPNAPTPTVPTASTPFVPPAAASSFPAVPVTSGSSGGSAVTTPGPVVGAAPPKAKVRCFC